MVEKLKRGDKGVDGRIFNCYEKNVRGETYAKWYKNEDAFIRAQLLNNIAKKKYYDANRIKAIESQRLSRLKNLDKDKARRKARYYSKPLEERREKRIRDEERWGPTYDIKRMVNAAKLRAERKGLEFNISVSDIILPTLCPVLGIPIFFNNKKSDGVKGPRPDSISLDRIDSSKGYTKDNIMIISWKANTLKNNGTLEDLEKIVAYMKANLPSEPENS